eukprot:TRINITY_DN11467_c0_g1_i1.p1 TRINITY_DN11467_c0_g1~~TRINITY_DN11467_c0_g1_i1.p1  ORF type:complete len:282 (-),score=38.66 TRINITY_DN11467_c0_g1_i1:39-884(-)
MAFNPTEVVIESFLEKLKSAYTKMYGSLHSDYAEIVVWAGRMALEIIADTDALYHNLEHTIHVTLVGQEILIGKQIRKGGVTPKDWVHFLLSLLCHDIGYVKGVCSEDDIQNNKFQTGLEEPKFVVITPGGTDASLTKHHVDRGKLFVKQRFAGHALIDADAICKNIELTRFPVPLESDYADTTGYPGLVRAADLMGQMSDPRYVKKIPALWSEFKETGEADKLGFKTPEDLRRGYPSFFWSVVKNYVRPAIQFLKVTQVGKQYLNNLLAGVSHVEHFGDL